MIREVRFYYSTDIRIWIKDIKADYTYEGFQSDCGFDCPTSYNNSGNTVVETMEEALEVVSEPHYQHRLAEHWDDCDVMMNY